MLPQTTYNLLSHTYYAVDTLGDYADQLIPEIFVELPDDPPEFVAFLNNWIIARGKPTTDAEPRFNYYEPGLSQSELIRRAQFKLLQSRDRTNVLCLGTRIADDRDNNSNERVVCFAVNTNVEKLKDRLWRMLLERIGEGPMLHILTTCSIFEPIGNDCHVQLCGTPLSDVLSSDKNIHKGKKRGQIADAEGGPPEKRQRVGHGGVASHTKQINTPADIPFARNRIFYSRPQLVGPNRVRLGIPSSHILNKVQPDRTAQDTPDSAQKKLEAAARHLSKYIFPRQYDLKNVFTCPKDKKSLNPFPVFDDREDDILFKGHCKTPKRLKPIISLLERLVKLHGRTTSASESGRANLKPDPTVFVQLKQGSTSDILEPNGILDLLTEVQAAEGQHMQPINQLFLTQAGMDTSIEVSHASLIVPHGASQAKRHAQAKPRFVDFACSHAEVYRIADCDWLIPDSPNAQARRPSVSDDLKKRELLNEFIYWFFDSFVLPLLKNTFYITDSGAYRNQVLYFRQDDWTKLCAPLFDRLSEGTFTKLGYSKQVADNVMRSRQLGYSYIRLLPKDTGVRPIVNLRRKPKAGLSINRVLQNAFQILSYEKTNQPDLLGASVFGLNEVYAKLKAFRKRNLLPNQTLPKLYFVKVDVRAAFDTIDQVKLVNILHELLSTEDYNVRRWSEVNIMEGGKDARRRYMKKAKPQWEEPQFSRFAETLAKVMHNAIYIDQVHYPSADKDEILKLLEEHIQQNLVKIGSDLYRQKVGIPQGSVLSTLLCSFFYGDLERKHFDFCKDLRNLLLRYVDDYLFITTRLSMARKFLDIMSKGHPEYGCFIAPEKTLTNFDCNEHNPNVVLPKEGKRGGFPWCGVRIDMQKLCVSADYTRLEDIHLSMTLTVQRGRKPGAAFRQRIIHAAKIRNLVIFNDTSFNGRKVVYLNIFQNFALTAMKMHCYLKSWRTDGGIVQMTRFILATIEASIYSSFASIRRKANDRLAKENGATFSIQRELFIWLGYKAFDLVLSRKRTLYVLVLEGIQKKLDSKTISPRTKLQMAQIKAIVRDGWANLAGLQY
ncbi:hypothetical protein FRC04_010103 [Tulasnella sp. 424]|nr:hypothetical protein FRC04_010103 [Tulasnella sp. 424]